MNVQVKVGDPTADPAFIDGNPLAHCQYYRDAMGTRVNLYWPYDTADLESLYWVTSPGSSLYEYGVWELDSAVRTADLLVDGFHNIFLATVGEVEADRWQDTCKWASYAALNDHLDANVVGTALRPASLIHPDLELVDELFTGIVLPRNKDSQAAWWGCSFQEMIERARDEAADHPDIAKVVTVDELGRFLDGPETTLYQVKDTSGGAYASWSHWGPDNVAALRALARGDGLVPAVDDVDAIGASAPVGAIPSGCPSSTPAAPSGDPDVELWARFLDVLVPRYVVPSVVLGVAADPDVVAGGAPSGAYAFDMANGDAAEASWTFTPPAPSTFESSHPNWCPVLSFLSASAVSPGLDPLQLELNVRVNGGLVPPLSGIPVDPTLRRADSIFRDVAPLGGPGCLVTPSPWNPTSSNTVRIEVAAADSPTNVDEDRLLYVWNARVRYVDTSTGVAFWSEELAPSTASFTVFGAPGSEVVATENTAWRVSESLDGVQIAPEIAGTIHDPAAYDEFMDSTCAYLHTAFDAPKRCLLDQRVEAQQPAYYPVDTDAALDRMQLASTYGDGIIGQYMPLNLENLGVEQGRFVQRESLDGSYDFMVYEPMDTQYSAQSEVHEFKITVPTDGGSCDGSTADPWVVEWDMDATTAQPRWELFVDWDDGSVRANQARKQVRNGSPDDTGSMDLPLAQEGHVIYVGWENEGGSGTTAHDAAVYFHVTPPSTCAAYDPLDAEFRTWLDDRETDPSAADQDCGGEVLKAYTCVADYFDTSWGLGASASPASCTIPSAWTWDCTNQWP